MRSSATIRIGISGWNYKPWRGRFYPKGLAQARELSYAAARFGSIEINSSFYHLLKPENYARWRDATPDDFVFAVKGSRYITHMLRLKNIDAALANFFASGILNLGPKLGPILWQFPPRMKFDPERFDAFFAKLPRDTEAAAALARRHDARVNDRAAMKAEGLWPLRHAVEIRHESFCDKAFVALLRRHAIALVVADTVDWPLLMDVTSDFVYCRLHGSKKLYVSGYDEKALKVWARRVKAWAEGREPTDAKRIAGPAKRKRRDVYVYFDNDAKVRAPVDARDLMRLLGLGE